MALIFEWRSKVQKKGERKIPWSLLRWQQLTLKLRFLKLHEVTQMHNQSWELKRLRQTAENAHDSLLSSITSLLALAFLPLF